ncbi:hypothetical protein SDC9_203014 [bioreactor metagenome]|uniref:Uncharacterized protein n=1 Tax=bioreactor metagenome TaxID=1076179 RepID=A0A645IWT6_9ZZZZ
MESAALQRGNAFGYQLFAAIDQACIFGAIQPGFLRNRFVVGFVRLTQIGGIGVRNRALLAHPAQCRAGIETAGKGDAHFLVDGNRLKYG